MNTVCLIGNLTRDPELRDAGETKVATIGLAVNGRKKQGENWIEVPNFFDVTLWGRQAELAGEHLSKGRQIAVTGRLQWDSWENEAGEKRSKVVIVGESFDFLAKPAEKPFEEQNAASIPVGDDIPY